MPQINKDSSLRSEWHQQDILNFLIPDENLPHPNRYGSRIPKLLLLSTHSVSP